MNEGESAAMWSLYAKTNEAIAVRSTYARLRDCLPSCAFVGEVRYIDYETEPIPIDNLFWPYVHKRKSYEHERELRAVIQEYPPPIEYDPADVAAARTFVPKDYPSLADQVNTERGRLVQLSIDELVEAVYVAPSAPTWFRDLVAAVTANYGLGDKEVKHSSLDTGPLH